MSIPEPALANSTTAWIVGIDLAWGEKGEDGLCLIHASRGGAKFIKTSSTQGDDELLCWLQQHVPSSECALLAIDAPLIVPNATGMRPVDKQITRLFGKYNAGAFPANSKLCVRPLRVAQLLRDNGYILGYDLKTATRIATEVYPHPAMIRLFDLDLIIKYKKKKKRPVSTQKLEFKRLQELLQKSLYDHRIDIEGSQDIQVLFNAEYSKTVEDKTDAVVCALIGYLHWQQQGHLSKIVGSIEEGFILLPPKYRNGFILMEGELTGQIVTMELVNRLRDEE